MNTVNAAMLLLASLTALTGLLGDKVSKPPDGTTRTRILPAGWLFIFLTVATLAIGLYKEHTSFEGQIRSIYPNFWSIVEAETTHDERDWTRYMSYRVSLRFLLQRLYRIVEGHPPEPSTPLDVILKAIGERGALPDELCKELDFIRWHTFRSEWGLGDGGDPKQLAKVDDISPRALRELQKIVETIARDSIQPYPESICGRSPAP